MQIFVDTCMLLWYWLDNGGAPSAYDGKMSFLMCGGGTSGRQFKMTGLNCGDL